MDDHENEHSPDNYEVGFGKPPKWSQFQKGSSGNPRGRPKGSTSVPALIRKIFEEKIRVKGSNGHDTMMKIEAAVTQLANKAAGGDVKAIRESLRLYSSLPEEPSVQAPTQIHVHFVDAEEGRPVNKLIDGQTADPQGKPYYLNS